MLKMSIKEAKIKNNKLQYMLDGVLSVLQDLFVDDAQFERFEDFRHEVLAIGDAEISFAETTGKTFLELEARRAVRDGKATH